MLFIQLFYIDELQLRLLSALCCLPRLCWEDSPLLPPNPSFLSAPSFSSQPGALDSSLPIFDLTKWAERGWARQRLTVDYEQTTLRARTNVEKLKLDLLLCHFFTLHCHNILSFVINYNSSSSIIVLLGKLDNIEHILCLSKHLGRQESLLH